MSNVSTYGILTKKYHLFSFPSYIRQLIPSLQHSSSSQPMYMHSIVHCTGFQFGKYPDGIFRHVNRRRFPQHKIIFLIY